MIPSTLGFFLSYLKDAVFAFFSTVGFAVLFNIPRKQLALAGLCGAFGWIVYSFSLSQNSNAIIASFLGGLIASLSGEVMARWQKQPATLYVVPGIIPLVPGYGLYYTMSEILIKDYQSAVSVGFETLLIAIAIASAIIIATSIGRVLKEWVKQ